MSESVNVLFKDHVIDVDTKEKSLDNCLVTVLISAKQESTNRILGYRCKYPKCYFIELSLDDAYQHVKCYHKIVRPFLCTTCKALFADTDQLLMHKKRENHNDNQLKCDIRDTAIFDINNRNDSMNNTRNTLTVDPRSDVETVEIPIKDNDLVTCVQSRTSGQVLSYRCKWQKCDYSERKKANVFNHVRQHIGKEPIVCFDCDEQFSSMKKLKRHKLKRDTKCAIECEQKLNKKSIPLLESMSSEIINKSKDIRNSLAEFGRKIWFKKHWIGVETYDRIEKNGLISSVISMKLALSGLNIGYRCLFSDCEFIRDNRSDVEKHITSKHGFDCGRQYKCTHCDEVFNNKAERHCHFIHVKHN